MTIFRLLLVFVFLLPNYLLCGERCSVTVINDLRYSVCANNKDGYRKLNLGSGETKKLDAPKGSFLYFFLPNKRLKFDGLHRDWVGEIDFILSRHSIDGDIKLRAVAAPASLPLKRYYTLTNGKTWDALRKREVVITDCEDRDRTFMVNIVDGWSSIVRNLD